MWCQDNHLFCSSPPTVFVQLPFHCSDREREEAKEGAGVEVNRRARRGEAARLQGRRSAMQTMGMRKSLGHRQKL